MKPCYRREGEFYLLAHLIRDGGHFEQPCKALISPGNCPTITRATGESLRRCGLLASKAAPLEEGSELAAGDSADSANRTDQLVHCKLVVGSCQLSTFLQVVEDVDFSEDDVLAKWHIHIGRQDFEALQCGAWDTDICYLSANPELDRLGGPPDCPLGCGSFTAALSNGHPDCLSYRHTVKIMHTVGIMHRRSGQIWHDDKGPYCCSKAACQLTAEALLYLHDVVGVPWDDDTCAAAAEAGSIDCLSYAHACGCPWNMMTCALAASAGKLHCLAYTYEHGCEWNRVTLEEAALNGHLECLRYAHTHGCPYIACQPVSFSWCGRKPRYLTTYATYSSSVPCLVYVREAMGCVWDPEGVECQVAFAWGNLELLQYIHSNGGVLCTQFDELCPHSESWLRDIGPDVHERATCLLYVHCYGGCTVKGIWDTEVGSLALEMIKARRVAVLLSFHVAGRARIEAPLIAAAHDAMQRMPSHVVWEVIRAAGLQVVE